MALAIGLLVATSLTLPILYTRGPNFISYYIKFGIYYLSLCSLTVLYTPYFVLRGRTADDPYFITKHWIWICKWTLGLRWEFSNSDVELTLHLRNSIKGGAVIVLNHQSSFDLIGLFHLWHVCGRLSVLGKKELLYLGPFGLACYYGGMTFIDRKKGPAALKSLTEAVILNKTLDLPVLVFPEGTRHHDRHKASLLPFKKGAFVAAIQAQVPIIPVVFSHYCNMDVKERILVPNTATMTVLEPINTNGLHPSKDFDKLMQETRQKMLDVFVKTSKL